MRSRNFSVSALAAISLLGFGTQAWAWGERGHHTVCEVAVKLVTNNKQTGAFARWLLPKGHMMGHVCNLPDISWRSMDTPKDADGNSLEGTLVDPRVGDEAHFINPENFGYKNADGSPNTIAVPLKYGKVEQEANGYKSAKQSAHQVSGSNWWRTQQLYSLAIERGRSGLNGIKELLRLERAFDKDFKYLKKAEKTAKAAVIATRKAEVDAQKDAINKDLRSMLIAMGIMGHFVGDAGQPFHNSSDYNGKESGHYGIHSYYESKIVDEISSDLQGEVYASVQEDLKPYSDSALKKILATRDPDPAYSGDPYNVIARMRALSALAGVQMKDILAIEESVTGYQKGELHKSKNPEGRPYADALASDAKLAPADWKFFTATDSDKVHPFNKFEQKIVNEMGVSAKLLATFWDGIYQVLDQRAKEVSVEIAAEEVKEIKDAGGDSSKVKAPYIELTKYYTTWDYPLDSPYIPPTYLVSDEPAAKSTSSGLSLKALAAGQYRPAPDLTKTVPKAVTLDDEEDASIDAEVGDLVDDGKGNFSKPKNVR